MTGNFARSIAGHDKGKLYVVIGEESSRLILSDGRYKTIENPKVKNRKHIQIVKCNDKSLKEKIESCDKDKNETIKRAIKLYEREDENV